MRIFVAGGTGVIGRHAVPLLVQAGHEVTVAARSDAKAGWVSGQGATPATMNVWDPGLLRATVAGHDAVINLTTAIPPVSKALWPGAWRENDRIRRELSRMLVDAALAAGATRYIQESIAFTYRDGGDRWLDEDAPVDAIDQTATALDAEAQCARFAEGGGGAGVVLRFGLFVDPPTSGAQLIDFARRGRLPLFGPASDYVSLLHTADTGSAVVAALTASTGVYNVVEDDPRPRGEHAEALGTLLGRRVRLMPAIVGKLPRLRTLARSQRVSNRRFRDATGWTARWGSDLDGWDTLIRDTETAKVPPHR